MSPLSSVFVESDESEKEPSTRRARSADENLDWLKEQERWRKHDQERQMVAYRNGNHYGASQQRTRADRLAVPIYEVSPRRPRARSDTRQRHDVHELSRNFTTLEVRPSSELIRRQDTSKEPAEVYVLPGHTRGSTHSKEPRIDKPKIKIPPVIVQEHPPVSNATDQKLGNSPSASPRSPSGQPQLQLKYLVLQNKLADISLACVRYIDVEAADPRDLTFEKISEQVKGFAFDLQVWSHIANIQNMARRDVPEHARAVADAAARNMDRLIERAAELHDACSRAKPSDLKFSQLAQVDDEQGMFDDADDQ
jgi:hypothetical protein